MPNSQVSTCVCLQYKAGLRKENKAEIRKGSQPNIRPYNVTLDVPKVCQTKVLEDPKEFKTIHKINKCKWHFP